jgi:carbon storage regulator
MLVLTRKVGEQIIIDGNIIVTITAIEGNKIRLGVQAPKSVTVDRAEIHARRIAEELEQPRTHRESVAV